ncbi:MAG TPA: hypothetical protein VMG41_17590 [Gemmatimonadales bacterium]|nr:hypothetical protein [Gemmatimonadales bacterium]
MKALPTRLDPADEGRTETGVRVADALAEAVAHGPYAALRTARSLSDEELRLGLDFVSTVLEVASSSARAMASVLAERGGGSEPAVH